MDEARYRDAEQRLWDSVGVAPTERVVHLDRTGVSVRIQEAGEGPPVVFVHGTSSSGSSWAGLVARLEGFRCLVLDRPGTGLSERPGRAFETVESFTEFADAVLVDVLDAMGLESAAVVSTSFGGYVALRAAALHPDRIRRIVEFGWTVGSPMDRLPVVMRLAAVPGVGTLLAALPPNEMAVRAMFRRIRLRQALDAGRVTQELIDCYLALLRYTDTMRNEVKLGRRLMSPLRGLDPRLLFSPSTLGEIRTPTYFLWGAEDPFGGPATARRFVEQLPNAELELLPGAGHAVWIDDPGYAAKTTTAFLTR